MKETLLIIPLILIFLHSCKDLYCGTDDYVTLKNNSDDMILVLAKIDPSDTLLPESLFDYQFDNCVIPGNPSSINLPFSNISDNDSVIFFVVQKRVFCEYSWHDIKKENKISARYVLKRYDIGSFKYLEIPYPPDNTMDNMNVYYKW